MRMPKRPHVLDFSLYPRSRLGRIDDLLRDELHGNLVACYGVYCHCRKRQASAWCARRRDMRRTLDLAEGSLRNLLDDGVLS